MKRILVSIYIDPEFYPPTKNAIFELAKDAEEVILLTRNLFNLEADSYPSNVRIIKVGKYLTVQESEKLNFFSKIITFLIYWYIQQRILILSRIDTAIFYDAIPLFTFFIGLKPKKVNYWYHNHDMPDSRFLRKFSIGWFSAIFEHRAMKKIKFFSLPSKDRLVYYPNWTDMERFFYIPNYPRIEQFKDLNLKQRFDNFTVIFQGAIGDGHGLEDLIKVLPQLPDVKLILKGPVRDSYKEKLISLANTHMVNDQLEWIGITPYNELIQLTSRCHIGIAIHQGKDEVSKTLGTASNKIFEYLACGLPIILYDNEQFRKNMVEANCVFYYSGNPGEYIKIIDNVRKNFNNISQLANKVFYNQYTFESYFQIVISKVNFLLSRQKLIEKDS